MTPRPTRRPVHAATGALAAAVLLTLAGCGTDEPAAAPRTIESSVQPPAIRRDLPYAAPDGARLTLDAYLPMRRGEPVPAVVLVHGGGFVGGAKDTGGMIAIARRLQDHGVAALTISYRLAPESTYPAPVDDVRAAVAWLRAPEQQQALGVDPDRVAVLGTSAGATLALTAAARPAAETGVRAVVALSAATLLTADGLALGTPAATEIASALAYLGCDAPETCATGTPASPALAVAPAASPALLVNGTAEMIPVGHAQAMADALGAAGVPHELVTVEGDAHGAELLDDAVWRTVLEFLDTHLAAPGTAATAAAPTAGAAG
ncbi:alpha/beta hydrolase [Cellulomonas sp.]|uniref:alpha/beta hydrolase n=1 Tax=Cellulomonas sp. TaxID=40001 RepID=UPI0028111EB7|nr:alpha/beta hydrolase [Cellulomonas sp.]